MLDLEKKSLFLKANWTQKTESACPGAKVRASVHRAGFKNRPGLLMNRAIVMMMLLLVLPGLEKRVFNDANDNIDAEDENDDPDTCISESPIKMTSASLSLASETNLSCKLIHLLSPWLSGRGVGVVEASPSDISAR